MKLIRVVTIPIGITAIPQVHIALTYPYFDAAAFTAVLDIDDIARNGIIRAEEVMVEKPMTWRKTVCMRFS